MSIPGVVCDPDYYDHFWIMLVSVPEETRVPAMQYLRSLHPNMGLMEAKYCVLKAEQGIPICIAEGISMQEAARIWHDLAYIGARVVPVGGYA